MDRTNTTIRDVASFLKWVKGNHTITSVADDGTKPSWYQSSVYYRGQANKTWELKPSAFRHNGVQEHELLQKAELMMWDKVASCKTYLEKLVYFQHYGLPTRLLDVTFNPLIALYMACDEEKERNHQGVVYSGYKSPGNIEEMRIVELTSEFLFTSSIRGFKHELDIFIEQKKSNLNYFTHPCLILPPNNNPRLEVQNGAFIMPPLINKISDSIPNKEKLDDSEFFDMSRAIIPASRKIEILQELSELGVNRGSIYKGSENKLISIFQQAKWNAISIDEDAIKIQAKKS